MLRVFEMFIEEAVVPLTVIAKDDVGAHRVFEAWAENHLGICTLDRPEIKLLSATELALQPQLAEAAAQGVPGVAQFLSHRAGWIVTAPQEPLVGAWAPPETDVRCFAAAHEAEETLVFALTLEHAAALYTHWNLDAYGDGPVNATIREMSRWLLRGPLVTLREEMDGGLTGIGMVCEDDFWRIFPPDHETPLGG